MSTLRAPRPEVVLDARPPRELSDRLPFPFLTLCWRVGLGGQWVRVPGVAAEDHLDRPRGGAPHTPSDAVMTVPTTPTGAMLRLLERSALAKTLREADPLAVAPAALDTLVLLCAAPGPDRTRSFPPLWRRLARVVLPPGGARYIPRPRTRYDPLTWTLLDRLLEQWELEGLTFVGRERRQLYLRQGTRRMARHYRVSRRRALACGRTAHRIWRHWYEGTEARRVEPVSALPLPPALHRTTGDAGRLYRAIRHAHRRGRPIPYTALVPASLLGLLIDEAERSIRSFPRSPVIPDWPVPPLPSLTHALLHSPLAAAARTAGLRAWDLWLTAHLAASLLALLTAPWPWGRPPCRS